MNSNSFALARVQPRHAALIKVGEEFFPWNKEWVVVWNLSGVFLGPDSQLFRFAEEENGFTRQVVEQSGVWRVASDGIGSVRRRPDFVTLATRRSTLLQESEFAAGWNDRLDGFLAGNLRERIELAE